MSCVPAAGTAGRCSRIGGQACARPPVRRQQSARPLGTSQGHAAGLTAAGPAHPASRCHLQPAVASHTRHPVTSVQQCLQHVIASGCRVSCTRPGLLMPPCHCRRLVGLLPSCHEAGALCTCARCRPARCTGGFNQPRPWISNEAGNCRLPHHGIPAHGLWTRSHGCSCAGAQQQQHQKCPCSSASGCKLPGGWRGLPALLPRA